MVWFYERHGRFLRCESRPAADGGYELIVTEPDGAERIERFDDSSELAHRQAELEEALVAEGWTGPHGRII